MLGLLLGGCGRNFNRLLFGSFGVQGRDGGYVLGLGRGMPVGFIVGELKQKSAMKLPKQKPTKSGSKQQNTKPNFKNGSTHR